MFCACGATTDGASSRPRATQASSASCWGCGSSSSKSPERGGDLVTQQGFTVWFTGLSGAGKTTIAHALEPVLRGRGLKVETLDGDVVRTNLSKGLGFSKEDRDTNILRIGFVAHLLSRNGVEVYVRCAIDELVRRDVKGLYEKALRGEIANFTGVSDPYEEPLSPEVVVETERESVAGGLAKVLAALEARGYLPAGGPK